MFVVKRSFKSLGKFYGVGSVITDPTSIKHFKSRLGAGDIIVVNEHNYNTCKEYFKVKHSAELPAIDAEASKLEVKTEPKEEAKPAVKAMAKPAVKAMAKPVAAAVKAK